MGVITRVRSAGVVPGCQVRHLGSLESAVRGGSRGLVRTQYVYRGSAPVQISARTLWAAVAVRLQGSLCTVDDAELGAGRADYALQKCGSENIHSAGQSPR